MAEAQGTLRRITIGDALDAVVREREAAFKALAAIDLALLADKPNGQVSRDSVRKARELIRAELRRLKR